MSLDEEIQQAMLANIKGPRKVTADGVSVEQHSPRDLMELDRYLTDKEIAKNPVQALKIVRIVPPGPG